MIFPIRMQKNQSPSKKCSKKFYHPSKLWNFKCPFVCGQKLGVWVQSSIDELMNTFKFVQCSKNDVWIRSMFVKIGFNPFLVKFHNYHAVSRATLIFKRLENGIPIIWWVSSLMPSRNSFFAVSRLSFASFPIVTPNLLVGSSSSFSRELQSLAKLSVTSKHLERYSWKIALSNHWHL